MNLCYEQYRALQILRDTPNLEGSAIAKQAECSWDELFELKILKLINLGIGRIKHEQVHPVIENNGLQVVTEAEKEGWV